MAEDLRADPGSFRDPTSRVYLGEEGVYRGLDANAASVFRLLKATSFYQNLLEEGLIVASDQHSVENEEFSDLRNDHWASVLVHPKLDVITYPYEWSFSMLKDAALLQLSLLKAAFDEGFTLKDSTPFNIQFVGTRPVFIDVPSFVRREDGEVWLGYRQFCMLYLYPLMVQSYAAVGFQSLLRANIDGITPHDASRLLRGRAIFRRGVISHVRLTSFLEERMARKQRDTAPPSTRRGPSQSDRMFYGLLDSMERLVTSLSVEVGRSDWTHYQARNTYTEDDMSNKVEFVTRALARRRQALVWDIGCNTGQFSRIAAEHADHVLAVDADHDSVEDFYRKLGTQNTITPLVMDLSNPSPDLGWANSERRSFYKRNRPSLVMCLALIHHIRISANVPLDLFFDWLRGLDAEVIVEYVDRDDEMVKKLLANKKETYQDYCRKTFEAELLRRFMILDSCEVKDGLRSLYHCSPI